MPTKYGKKCSTRIVKDDDLYEEEEKITAPKKKRVVISAQADAKHEEIEEESEINEEEVEEEVEEESIEEDEEVEEDEEDEESIDAMKKKIKELLAQAVEAKAVEAKSKKKISKMDTKTKKKMKQESPLPLPSKWYTMATTMATASIPVLFTAIITPMLVGSVARLLKPTPPPSEEQLFGSHFRSNNLGQQSGLFSGT
jgi:hypothetical protein